MQRLCSFLSLISTRLICIFSSLPFSHLSSTVYIPPTSVLAFLNEMFCSFDNLTYKCGLEKIKTVCYFINLFTLSWAPRSLFSKIRKIRPAYVLITDKLHIHGGQWYPYNKEGPLRSSDYLSIAYVPGILRSEAILAFSTKELFGKY